MIWDSPQFRQNSVKISAIFFVLTLVNTFFSRLLKCTKFICPKQEHPTVLPTSCEHFEKSTTSEFGAVQKLASHLGKSLEKPTQKIPTKRRCKVCKFSRCFKMLQNQYLVAKIGSDGPENERRQICFMIWTSEPRFEIVFRLRFCFVESVSQVCGKSSIDCGTGFAGMWKIDYRTGGTPTSSKPLL